MIKWKMLYYLIPVTLASFISIYSYKLRNIILTDETKIINNNSMNVPVENNEIFLEIRKLRSLRKNKSKRKLD